MTTKQKRDAHRWCEDYIGPKMEEKIKTFKPKARGCVVDEKKGSVLYFIVVCDSGASSDMCGVGLAICSEFDRFDLKEGTHRAVGRAVKALTRRGYNEEICTAWVRFPSSWTKGQIDRVRRIRDSFSHKSFYLPFKTFREEMDI